MKEHHRDALRKEFEEYFMVSSLPTMRLGLLVTMIMFSFFAFFNLIFFPDSPEQSYYSRFWIISPFMVISIMVTYIKPLYKWLRLTYIILNVFICLAILYVGIQSEPTQKGSEYYFAWVMLVVIGFFVFYRMSFFILVVIAIFQVVAYTIATILNHTFEQHPFFFFNNLFFVLAIFSIGYMMAYMYRKLNWKNFLHQKALTKSNLQLQAEIKERKQAVEALQRSEILYHDTLDAIPDWIYVVDRDKKFVMLNSALQEEHLRQGFTISCLGKRIDKVYPFIPSSTIHEIDQVFTSGKIIIGEQQFFLRDKTIYGETRKVPIFKDNQVIQVLTIMRNRSKEKEIEELKQRNVEQKEIMLREIHHRVKNNLAIVISLLNLQLRNNNDAGLARIIRDIEMRIRSMALIHEHLYRSENIDRIPLASYLHSLATIITGAFSGRRIKLVTSLEPIDVNIETALPLGLIANELLTNAFKYAFVNDEDGEIQVLLVKENEDEFSLIIKDNGVGLPDSFSMDSEKTLGVFIVRLLVEQLDGKLEITRRPGTTFTLHFKNLLSK
jgi:two-component sensor histidine kinase